MVKCPYCGNEIPIEEYSEHYEKCPHRLRVPPKVIPTKEELEKEETVEVELYWAKILEKNEAKLQAFVNAVSKEWDIVPPKVILFRRKDMAQFERIFPELAVGTAAFYYEPDHTIFYGGALNRTKILHELLHHQDSRTSKAHRRTDELFEALKKTHPEKTDDELWEMAKGISIDSIEYEIEDKVPKLVRQYAELWRRLVEE